MKIADYESYYNLPLGRILVRKYLAMLRWLPSNVYSYFASFRRLKETYRLRNSALGPALVVGSGPKLNNSINSIHDLIKGNENLAIFGVNSIVLHQKQLGFTFNHYVLADPVYFNDSDNKLVDVNPGNIDMSNPSLQLGRLHEFKEVLRAVDHQDLICFIPSYVSNRPEFRSKSKYFPFLERTSTKYSNFESLRWPLGTNTSTAQLAIVLAHFLGHSPVYVAGLDGDSWVSTRRASDGKIHYSYKHFYNEDSRLQDFTYKTGRSFDLLSSAAGILRTQFKMKSHINIVYLDETSMFNED